MSLELIIAAVLVVPILLYLYLTWSDGYWAKRNVPFEKPIPGLGNFYENIFGWKNMCEIQKEIYDKFEGYSYCGIFKLRQPSILLRDPSVIKTVMIENFSSFHNNDIHINEKTDPMMGKNPFVLDGERWRKARKQIVPSMSGGRIKSMFPLITKATDHLVEYLLTAPEAKAPEGISAKEISAKFTTDVIGAFVFGIDENPFDDKCDSKCRQMGQLIMDTTYWNSLQHFIVLMYPRMADLLNFKFIKDEAANYFRFLVSHSLAYRRNSGFSRPDFLDYMIQLNKKMGPEISDELITAYTSTFFTDGFDTSSTGLCYALYEIAANPNVFETLRAEVDDVLSRHDGVLNHESVQEMEYLDRVVSEVMRKHPPATYTMKLCTNKTTLPNPSGSGPDIPIEVGTSLFLPIYSLHQDPKFYPEPQVFDPDRFLPEAVASRPRMSYIPFGDGPRICLGVKLALAQIKTPLAAIVHKLDISLNKRTLSPLPIDPLFFLIAPKGGIWVNFEKRKC